jgi:hypothetical protein
MVLIFGVILTGCPVEPSETTYTVWTDTVSYSEFSKAFGTIDDGYYVRTEITNSEFKQLSLTNEGKHQWTEDQIYNWFIGIGFGKTEATKEKAWFTTIDHGFLASRDRSLVYMILK